MTTATGFPADGGRVPADTLAHRLQLLRDELGWSQRKAAQECGLGFGEWQSMENGARARGLDEKVARIAARTGYSPVWLMWGGPLQRTDHTTAGETKGAAALPRSAQSGTPNGPRESRYATTPVSPVGTRNHARTSPIRVIRRAA